MAKAETTRQPGVFRIARAHVLSLLLAAGTLLGSSLARADDGRACGGASGWISVQLSADTWTAEQRAHMLADLGRALSPQGIGVCSATAKGNSAPLASVVIALGKDERAVVSIDVQDAVTHKRVTRELDLAPIPADGRELAVAIETDELLRASWAEVAFDTVRARAMRAERGVTGSVGAVLSPSRVRNEGAFGGRASGERYAGGLLLLGADGYGRLPLARQLGLELAAGIRASPSHAAPHGKVSALSAGGSLSLALRALAGRAASLDVGAGFSGSFLQFRAEPDAGATAARYSNFLLVGELRVTGRLALGRSVHAVAGLMAGETLHGVRATDAGRVVLGASGLSLGATLGLEVP